MMLRYASITASFDHSRDILVEMTSSLALRTSPPRPERASPTKAFFTYCCVMVDPPCRSPPKRLFLNARRKPLKEKPGLV
jgi:hypothetical protein